jgi:uncharacterized membrane protein YhiD involved in acid resistance
MTFQDIFKNDFLTQTIGDITVLHIALMLLLSFALGTFIFFVYKKTFQGTMYSKTFNVSLVALAMISSTVIMAVTSNIVLSLGMVGALSIVRFRTAIKDPIDIVYMFWAISIGIMTGAGLWMLSIISSLIIGLILFVFSKVHIRYEPYLLIVRYTDGDKEKEIYRQLDETVGSYKVKSKIKSPDNFELTVDIKVKSDKSNIVNTLDDLEGINSVAMVSYDGDYAA